MKLPGCGKLPEAPRHWAIGHLRRVGRTWIQAMQGLAILTGPILAAGLYNRTQITYWTSATVIESRKRQLGTRIRSTAAIRRFWSGTSLSDQVVAVEFREGNEGLRTKRTYSSSSALSTALPEGVSVSDVRIDAAGYQAGICDFQLPAMDSWHGLCDPCKMDSAVKETISEIKDCEWRPLVYRDGEVNRTQNRFVARCM